MDLGTTMPVFDSRDTVRFEALPVSRWLFVPGLCTAFGSRSRSFETF
jgi:hypothetical protein